MEKANGGAQGQVFPKKTSSRRFLTIEVQEAPPDWGRLLSVANVKLLAAGLLCELLHSLAMRSILGVRYPIMPRL